MEGYELENYVDVVKEEICGNGTADDLQTSMLVNLAENLNGQIVFALDEYGNQIALGVILNEDFATKDGILETNEDTNAHDANQFPWIAGEEECVSMATNDQELAFKDQEMSNLPELTCHDGNVKADFKSKAPLIKVYKVQNAARKTLKKMKLANVRKKNCSCILQIRGQRMYTSEQMN